MVSGAMYMYVSENLGSFEPRREKTRFCICENKDADQLFSLHVWYNPSTTLIRNFKPLAIFCGCPARFVSDLVGNPEDRFSHNEAHLIRTHCYDDQRVIYIP